MNLIAAVTQFFRPAPAVVMQDDHAFLLDDPTIVEIRQSIQVSDVQLSAMNRHSSAFIQHLHYTQAAGNGKPYASQPGESATGGSNLTTFALDGQVNDEAYREACHNAIQLIDQQKLVAPPGTFPLPEDAQQYHHAPRVLRDIPTKHVAQRVELTANHHSHDIAFHVQRGDQVVRPTFDEDAPRIKVGDVDDHLASNTGAGSPRSQLMYQLNLIRDAVASAQNQNRDVGYELDPKIIELYEDSFSAFVHEKMSNTVTLICQLYNEDRNGLFETVENLGYTLWTPDKGKNLYLKILTRTAKIHL